MIDPSCATPSPCPVTPFSWAAAGRLVRLRNQTGTWLLMLPTLWSLVLAARGMPPLRLVLIFSLGSFLMRSAGVILNDLADRRVDRHVARTRSRPLASGELSSIHALAVLAGLLVLALVLVLLLNRVAILLSPVALLLATLYPFAKRFIQVPQAMLGIAFGWGTIMAWAASRDTIDPTAWLLFAATVCWAIGYDTIYALQDLEDDRRVGVKSSALFFGPSVWVAVWISLLAMLLLLGLAAWRTGIGQMFYVMLGGVGLFCSKQAMELRTPVSPARAFRLFHQHVWVGTAVLAGALCGFLL